jgi:acetyl esterase
MHTRPTLDPGLIALIDGMRAAPPLESLPMAAIRDIMRVMGTDPGAPQSIGTSDLTIPGLAGPLRARRYRPAGAKTAGPGIVYFHGGGFIGGDLDTHDGACRRLSRASNVQILAIDYRLAPEHPLPAPFDDAEAAVRWTFDHADDLGLTRERIGVCGDSAGALLSAWVSVVLQRDVSRPIRSQTLIYPPFMFEGTTSSRAAYDGYLLTAATMKFFTSCFLGANGKLDDPRLNLLEADVSSVAPAHVVVAGFDPLKDEGESYAKHLKASGAAVKLTVYPAFPHGFINMAPQSSAVAAAVDEIGASISESLA